MSKKRGSKKTTEKKTYKTSDRAGGNKGKESKRNGNYHPLFSQELTFGQRASDVIANFGGSWTFISLFFIFLFGWIGVNTWIFLNRGFDPYPYVLLNLFLSCLAAIQAPIILMAQNRQAQRDRIDAKYDHQINRKAEREIQRIQKDLYSIRRMIKSAQDKNKN